MFCKNVVLGISQNSSENTCIGFLSFSEVAGYKPITLLKIDSSTGVLSSVLQKKKILQKISIADIRLGSKYALTSGAYW